MNSFINFLNESNLITVYHGDNYGTKKLDPKLMLHGKSNNQEGVGIYFTEFAKTAQSYGKNIVTTEIDKKKFLDSRANVSKIPSGQIMNLMKHLHKQDNEPLWYFMTDWGFDISEPEDVEDYHFVDLYNKIKTEEIRNFQIQLTEKFDVESFVEAWNKFVKFDGTYQKQPNGDVWYAIINTKAKLRPYTI